MYQKWRRRFQIIWHILCEFVRKIIIINHTLRESSQRVSGIIKDGKDALLVAALFEANMIDKCHSINKSNIEGLEFEVINDIAYVWGSHEATLCVREIIIINNFVNKVYELLLSNHNSYDRLKLRRISIPWQIWMYFGRYFSMQILYERNIYQLMMVTIDGIEIAE